MASPGVGFASMLILLMSLWAALCVWYYSAHMLNGWLEDIINEKVALVVSIVVGLVITLALALGALILIFNTFSRGPLVT
jgi:hypothetical protein